MHITTGKAAIMQPYIFPYLGYFHLIEASDTFIFYDDVNYIKRGWINRNRIGLNNKAHRFTLPIKKASQNVLIKDTRVNLDKSWQKSFFSTLTQAYRTAPHFDATVALIEGTFIDQEENTISSLAIRSIEHVYRYLEIKPNFIKSSVFSPETRGLERSERLIQITKKLGYNSYINLLGGKELYTKEYFRHHGINLNFIKSLDHSYKQHSDIFIPALSIIDILMFNDKEATKHLFHNFTLI